MFDVDVDVKAEDELFLKLLILLENKDSVEKEIKEVIDELINDHEGVDAKYRDDKTLLHHVCATCSNTSIFLNIINYLIIDKKADVTVESPYGETFIHAALMNQSLSVNIIQSLINQNKIDINTEHKDQNLFLHFVFVNPNVTLETVHFFAQGNKDYINKKNAWLETPFHYACLNNSSEEIIKYFIENGANINQKDGSGNTPFHKMCANPNVSLEIIKCFMENKADFNQEDDAGITPFNNICSNPNASLETIKYFIEKKANPNHKEPFFQNTLLHYICQKEFIPLEFIKYLIENGANVNAQSCFPDEKTPLHYAFINENISIDVLKCLFLEGKGRLDIEDANNNTPVDYAIEQNNVELLNFLLFHAVNKNDQNLFDQLIVFFNNSDLGFDNSIEKINIEPSGDKMIAWVFDAILKVSNDKNSPLSNAAIILKKNYLSFLYDLQGKGAHNNIDYVISLLQSFHLKMGNKCISFYFNAIIKDLQNGGEKVKLVLQKDEELMSQLQNKEKKFTQLPQKLSELKSGTLFFGQSNEFEIIKNDFLNYSIDKNVLSNNQFEIYQIYKHLHEHGIKVELKMITQYVDVIDKDTFYFLVIGQPCQTDYYQTLSLPVELQLTPEKALEEMFGLKKHQLAVLRYFYKDGLRGNDLRSLNNPSIPFTIDHYLMLVKLVEEKNIPVKEALKDIVNMSWDSVIFLGQELNNSSNFNFN